MQRRTCDVAGDGVPARERRRVEAAQRVRVEQRGESREVTRLGEQLPAVGSRQAAADAVGVQAAPRDADRGRQLRREQRTRRRRQDVHHGRDGRDRERRRRHGGARARVVHRQNGHGVEAAGMAGTASADAVARNTNVARFARVATQAVSAPAAEGGSTAYWNLSTRPSASNPPSSPRRRTCRSCPRATGPATAPPSGPGSAQGRRESRAWSSRQAARRTGAAARRQRDVRCGCEGR